MSLHAIPAEPPLTAEEAASLPEDEEVIVVWEGGNGPAHYRVAIDRRGQRYAAPLHHGGGSRMEFCNPLEFVGQGRYHTRVWRAHPEHVLRLGRDR